MTCNNKVKENESIVKAMLRAIGEKAEREGLKGTPARVVASWEKLFGGYSQRPERILATRFRECNKYDQMIWMTDISFYSTCEHHLLPFFGKAHIAYIPDPNCGVVGASKLVRLVDCFSRRLQIQERLTGQIADAIERNLHPLGCGVIIIAQHFCMTARGVERQEVLMKTSAIRGLFMEEKVKQEFMGLCFNGRT